MIKYDVVLVLFYAVCSAELVFAFVSPETLASVDAFGLLVAFMFLAMGVLGYLLTLMLSKKDLVEGFDSETSEGKAVQMELGVIFALIVILLSNKWVPEIVQAAGGFKVVTEWGIFTLSTATAAAGVSAFLFGVFLVPVAQENFFRGFIANLFIGRSTGAKAFVGIFLQAVVFMLFHVPAYGWTTDLWVILSVGFIIGAIGNETGRLSVCIVAHVANNFLAWSAATGVLPVGQFGSVTVAGYSPLLMVSLAVSLFALRAYHGKPLLPFSGKAPRLNPRGLRKLGAVAFLGLFLLGLSVPALADTLSYTTTSTTTVSTTILSTTSTTSTSLITTSLITTSTTKSTPVTTGTMLVTTTSPTTTTAQSVLFSTTTTTATSTSRKTYVTNTTTLQVNFPGGSDCGVATFPACSSQTSYSPPGHTGSSTSYGPSNSTAPLWEVGIGAVGFMVLVLVAVSLARRKD